MLCRCLGMVACAAPTLRPLLGVCVEGQLCGGPAGAVGHIAPRRRGRRKSGTGVNPSSEPTWRRVRPGRGPPGPRGTSNADFSASSVALTLSYGYEVYEADSDEPLCDTPRGLRAHLSPPPP